MDRINQKIIEAIIKKAETVCPGSLALIGIYGSVATGDAHEKSDLDLLILTDDDAAAQLGTGFILDDRQVGYDLYCTHWDALRYDAECRHAHLSKLLDSQIVHVARPEAYDEFCALQAQARQLLASDARLDRANDLLSKAKSAYANACLYDAPGRVRLEAFGVMYYLTDALMLHHGAYFKYGTKRTPEELCTLPSGEAFVQIIRKIVVAGDVGEIRALLKELLLCAENHMRQEKPKAEPSHALSGTYEEMVSNWRNKMIEAAENDDAFSAYMNLCNFHFMLSEIGREVNIGTFPVMDEYDPASVRANAETFDKYLRLYEQIYRQAGIEIRRYADVDAFVTQYLQQ